MKNNGGDAVRDVFDDWAKEGKSEQMEEGHRRTVMEFLRSKIEKPDMRNKISFLDVGCGNGWAVREILNMFPNCERAIGIDKSPEMIKKANKKKEDSREEYYCADVFEFEVPDDKKFDYVFSMEFLYYCFPMEPALKRIRSFLVGGKGSDATNRCGSFICGTDYYLENKDSHSWPDTLGVKMDLRSKDQWKAMFYDCGFDKVSLFQITDPNSNEKWKQELGTLFVVGTRKDGWE